MPRSAGYHRIYKKRTNQPDEENLFKRKKQHANSSSAVSYVPTIAKTTVQRAKTAPQDLTPQEMRQLQSTIGNHALSQMMASQTTQGIAAVSNAQVIRRTPVKVKQNTPQTYIVQRWKWPWRRGETPQDKYDRYTKTMERIEAAKLVLRLGHGVVLLPLTVIDLISNIVRPLTENPAVSKSGTKKEQVRRTFDNVLNGESMLVSLMAGRTKTVDLKIMKYMPWNVLPWIIAALNRWDRKVAKKRRALNL